MAERSSDVKLPAHSPENRRGIQKTVQPPGVGEQAGSGRKIAPGGVSKKVGVGRQRDGKGGDVGIYRYMEGLSG